MPTPMRASKPDKAGAVLARKREISIDNCIQAIASLNQTATEVADWRTVLRDIKAALEPEKITENQKRKVLQTLNQLVIDAQRVSKQIKSCNKALSPVPGLQAGLNRAAAIRREALGNQPLAISSTAHERLAARVDEFTTVSSKKGKSSRTTASGTKKASPSDDAVGLVPLPIDGVMYDRRELLGVLIQGQENSNKGLVIREIIEKKLVPVKQSTIYLLWQQFQKHKQNGGTLDTFPNDHWFKKKGKEPFDEFTTQASRKRKSSPTTANSTKPTSSLDDAVGLVSLPCDESTTPPSKKRNSSGTAASGTKEIPPSDDGLVSLPFDESTTPPSEKRNSSKTTASDTTQHNPSDDAVGLVPLPIDGVMYDRHELLRVLTQGQKNSNKGLVIREVIKKKLVPIKQSSIYLLWQQFQKHKKNGGSLDTFPNDHWFKKKGREPFLLNTEVEEIAAWLKTQPGRTIPKDELRTMMIQKKRDRLEREGQVVLEESMITPCDKVVENYSVTITDLAGGSAFQNSIPKTPKTRKA